jgi:hypothetical protein
LPLFERKIPRRKLNFVVVGVTKSKQEVERTGLFGFAVCSKIPNQKIVGPIQKGVLVNCCSDLEKQIEEI